jgi:Uma2 family endonuclease
MARVPAAMRWTIADLDALPDDESRRYEIIDGELYVSRAPHWQHQATCVRITTPLENWNSETGLGEVLFAPGVIFSEWDAVIPDVVWISRARLTAIEDAAGHLQGAPELAVEVLSPGADNTQRDRELKLKLYSRRGVHEYWIVDWRARTVAVYRRQRARLRLFGTLNPEDTLTSPLLPGFALPVARLFARE